jgi:hypothetical protein
MTMSKLVKWLSGKKVYIVTGCSVVYGVLAMTHHAPNPDQLGVYVVQFNLLAAAFRATAGKFLDALQK